MSETKWTPGPWRIEKHDGADGKDDAITYSINAGRMLPDAQFPHWPHQSEFNVVEISCDRDYYFPEGGIKNQHDAHLIAAAPELYEALKAIVDFWHSGTGSPDKTVRMLRDSGFIDDACAALAKAEGKQ